MSDADPHLQSLDRRLAELGKLGDDGASAEWTPPARRVPVAPVPPSASAAAADVAALAEQLSALTTAVHAMAARLDQLLPHSSAEGEEVEELLADLRGAEADPRPATLRPTAGIESLEELRLEMRQALLEIATAWQRWRDTSDAATRELADGVSTLLRGQGERTSEPEKRSSRRGR